MVSTKAKFDFQLFLNRSEPAKDPQLQWRFKDQLVAT